LRDRIDALVPTAAPVTTSSGPVMRPDLRNNERVLFDDTALASDWFARARTFFPPQLFGPRAQRRRWSLMAGGAFKRTISRLSISHCSTIFSAF
jgi:hypothetical protein